MWNARNTGIARPHVMAETTVPKTDQRRAWRAWNSAYRDSPRRSTHTSKGAKNHANQVPAWATMAARRSLFILSLRRSPPTYFSVRVRASSGGRNDAVQASLGRYGRHVGGVGRA